MDDEKLVEVTVGALSKVIDRLLWLTAAIAIAALGLPAVVP